MCQEGVQLQMSKMFVSESNMSVYVFVGRL